MADQATPNLPSRDFAATARFFAALGFAVQFQSDNWMILSRGTVQLEFFPYLDLDPYQSSFSCCVRLDQLADLMVQLKVSGVPEARTGIPRYHPPTVEPSGLTIAYLVDPDGTLVRLIQNN